MLRTLKPRDAAGDEFVFQTPRGTPIDEVNFQRREWLPALHALGIRPRPFYNCRHTYISMLLAAGAKPLFVCRQTGTSLEMIEVDGDDAPPSRAKEPTIFYGLPLRAGDWGRTGDFQLGKLI